MAKIIFFTIYAVHALFHAHFFHRHMFTIYEPKKKVFSHLSLVWSGLEKLTGWLLRMWYLISWNPLLFKNIAYVQHMLYYVGSLRKVFFLPCHVVHALMRFMRFMWFISMNRTRMANTSSYTQLCCFILTGDIVTFLHLLFCWYLLFSTVYFLSLLAAAFSKIHVHTCI